MFSKRLFTSSAPTEIPSYQEFPNIPAEYHYLKQLKCPKCGQTAEANRRGSQPDFEKRRMEDLWEVHCPACPWRMEITMSVPFMEQLVKSILGEK